MKLAAVYSQPLQYVFVLGFPPALCVNYDWQDIFKFDDSTLPRFIKFMFLPERPQFYSLQSREDVAKTARLLIPDFFQLLLAACQCAVFDNEEKARFDRFMKFSR